MMWTNQPIPLGPLYYSFWAGVLIVLLLIVMWLPELQRNRVPLTIFVLVGYVLLLLRLWR